MSKYCFRCKYRNMITGENSLSNPATLIVTGRHKILIMFYIFYIKKIGYFTALIIMYIYKYLYKKLYQDTYVYRKYISYIIVN